MMVLYRVPTSGREGLAEVLDRGPCGEVLVEDLGRTRWIPPGWVVEEEED